MIPEGDKWGSGEFPEPELGPGFARRVLRLAVIERRRRVRRHFFATVGLCAIVSFVGTILVRDFVTRKQIVTNGRSAESVARNRGIVKREESNRERSGIGIGTVDEASQRDAIDYLFPDAQWSGNLALTYGSHAKANANAADSAAFSPIIQRRCPECPAKRVKHKQQMAESDMADDASPPQLHQIPPALPLAPAGSRRQSETP
jgi:hypothetical protein